MKPTNLIDIILNDKSTEAEKKLLYKAVINAMTGAVASNILRHIAEQRRQEVRATENLDSNSLGAIPSYNGEATLDQFNALENQMQGDLIAKQLAEEAGHEGEMPPIHIAEICNGVRFALYEEFGDIVDLNPSDALNHEPKFHSVDSKINWDQPMSLEFNMKFRCKMAGNINEARVLQAAKEDNEDVNFIREVMRKDAERVARALTTAAPEVLLIADGFQSDGYTRDAFVSLPLDVQLRLGTKVSNTLNNEYQRLYGIRLRTGNLEVANQAFLVKKNWEVVKDWCNQLETLLAKEAQRERTTM